MTNNDKAKWRAQFVAALDGHTKLSRDCHLSGEYLTMQIWSLVEQIICNEIRELTRTRSEAEAAARVAGYQEGQHDLRKSIASILGISP